MAVLWGTPEPSLASDCGPLSWYSLPRWSAPLALLAGFAFIADGIAVGTDGFIGGAPNLLAWAAFIVFAVIATIAAWRRASGDLPAEHYASTV